MAVFQRVSTVMSLAERLTTPTKHRGVTWGGEEGKKIARQSACSVRSHVAFSGNAQGFGGAGSVFLSVLSVSLKW